MHKTYRAEVQTDTFSPHMGIFTRATTIGQKTHARRRGIERGGAKTERGGRGRFLTGY